MINQLMALGPVFFGVLIFAPMWAAVLDALEINLVPNVSNLLIMLVLGFCWGAVAKVRRRWL